MFKIQITRKKKQSQKAVQANPLYCIVSVYNNAIRGKYAEHKIYADQKHMLGIIKSQYPTDRYTLDVCYFK